MKRRRPADTATTEIDEESVSPESGRPRRRRRSSTDRPAKSLRLQATGADHSPTRQARSRTTTQSVAGSATEGFSRRTSHASAAGDVAVAGLMRESMSRDTLPSSQRSGSSGTSKSTPKPHPEEHDATSTQDQDASQTIDSPGKDEKDLDVPLDSIEVDVEEEDQNNLDADSAEQDVETGVVTGKPQGQNSPLKRTPRRGHRTRLTVLNVATPLQTTPAGSAMPSPVLALQDFNDVDTASNDASLEKATKRLPGRRRAPHPDVNIEADLRRQLNLKMAYRSVAKLQKVALAELARRSLYDLETKPDCHEETEQYHIVREQLDERLHARLAVLEHTHRLNKSNVENKLRWEKEVQDQIFQNKVRDLQDEYQIRAEHRALRLLRRLEARQKQLHETQRALSPVAIDSDATEDEGDGVIPALKAPASKWTNGHVLDKVYDSRSRFYVLTDEVYEQTASRLKTAKERSDHIGAEYNAYLADDVDSRTNFATYDSAMYRARGFLSAASQAARKEREDEMFIPDTSQRIEDGLTILAAAAEKRHIIPEPTVTAAPVTPAQKARRNTHNKTVSVDSSTKPAVQTTPLETPSTKRKRAPREKTRENSPSRQTPTASRSVAQPESLQTPRVSSNKIADLLNTDQPTPSSHAMKQFSMSSSSTDVKIKSEELPRSTGHAFLPSIMDMNKAQNGNAYAADKQGGHGYAMMTSKQDAGHEQGREPLRNVLLTGYHSILSEDSKVGQQRTSDSAGAARLGSQSRALSPFKRQRSPDRHGSGRRSPVQPPLSVDGHASITHSKYSTGSNSAMASPATHTMQSPASHHSRGLSYGQVPRPLAWESDAVRRASAAVPPQYSSTERVGSDRPHEHAPWISNSPSTTLQKHSRAGSYDRMAPFGPPHQAYPGPFIPSSSSFHALPPPRSSTYGAASPTQQSRILGSGPQWAPNGPQQQMAPPQAHAPQQTSSYNVTQQQIEPIFAAASAQKPYDFVRGGPPSTTSSTRPRSPGRSGYDAGRSSLPSYQHYQYMPNHHAQTSQHTDNNARQSSQKAGSQGYGPYDALQPANLDTAPGKSTGPDQGAASAVGGSKEQKKARGSHGGWILSDPFRQWDGGAKGKTKQK